ncbi:hypothetical protein PI124_g15531 [Phytophthora idaei]|nr:hypothetical protein PI126_g14405 [Phytophthora idaei]KAG3239540.1 hypothetical protein PI124_g15531 [Phytophthora idaei]
MLQTDTITNHRGNGVRRKFHYFLPLVGKVCALSFCPSYGITLVTVQRYEGQIFGGTFAAKPHGNKKNKNASVIDIRWLIDWFTEFAKEVGDVVPVRVRMKKTVDGTVRKYYSSEQFTFLPAYFTWGRLYDEMREFVELSRIRSREPGNLPR